MSERSNHRGLRVWSTLLLLALLVAAGARPAATHALDAAGANTLATGSGDALTYAPPGAPLAAVQRNTSQKDLFVLGNDGAIYTSFATSGSAYSAPLRLTFPNLAPPNGGIAAVMRHASQEDVFVAGYDGAIWTTWQTDNGPWQPAIRVTPRNVVPVGARLAAVARSATHLDVFYVGSSGAIWTIVAKDNQPWSQPIPLTPPNLAPAGAWLAARMRNATQEDLFVVGTTGAIWTIWQTNDGAWAPPLRISPVGLAPAGAGIAVAMRSAAQEDVFVVGVDGAITTVWEVNNGAWQGPLRISPTGLAPAGAPVAASTRGTTQEDVFVVGTDQTIKTVWEVNNGPWQGPLAIGKPDTAPAGAALAALGTSSAAEVFVVGLGGTILSAASLSTSPWSEPAPARQPRFRDYTRVTAVKRNSRQVDVFAVDADGTLWSFFAVDNGPWSPPVELSAPGVMSAGGLLTAVRRNDRQIDVYSVGIDCSVYVTSGQEQQPWSPPRRLTSPGFVNCATTIAAVARDDHEVDVVFIGRDGAIHALSQTDAGAWQGPLRVTPANWTFASGGIAATRRNGRQIDVFAVDFDGRVSTIWQVDNGAWQGPLAFSASLAAGYAAPIAAIARDDGGEDVFVLGSDGTLNTYVQRNNGGWQGPQSISPRFAVGGGEIIAAVMQTPSQAAVYARGSDGAITAYTQTPTGIWQGPVAISKPGLINATAPIAAVTRNANQVDVVTIPFDPASGAGRLWSVNGNTGADTDQDGARDYQEQGSCTSPTNPDTDRDALPDGWELFGLRFADGDFIGLPAMGANPCRKDVFVQYDYERGAKVENNVWQQATNTFAANGITLHVVENERPRPTGSVTSTLTAEQASSRMDATGAFYFAPHRAWTHHYVYSRHFQGTSGAYHNVTIDIDTKLCPLATVNPQTDRICGPRSAGDQVYRIIHELGHNMGLGHGGRVGSNQQKRVGDVVVYDGSWDSTNQKPNYISVMNYRYNGTYCYNPVSGDYVGATTFADRAIPDLDERNLDERGGVFATALQSEGCSMATVGFVPVFDYSCTAPDGTPYIFTNDGERNRRRLKNVKDAKWETSGFPALQGIDWNCDGVIGTMVTENINGDGHKETFGTGPADEILRSTDDWAGLPYSAGTACNIIGQQQDRGALYPVAYFDAIGSPGCRINPELPSLGVSPGATPEQTLPPLERVIETQDDIDLGRPRLERCDGVDNDGDGMVDENCRDVDADTVADAIDNCPRTANRSQADMDANLLGDACEQTTLTSLTADAQGATVVLHWTGGSPDILGFNVYRIDHLDAREPGSIFLGAGYPSTTATSFTDNVATAGRYRYEVHSVNRLGQEGIGRTAEVTLGQRFRVLLPVLRR